MMVLQLLKFRFTSILIILFMAVQMSACSSEEETPGTDNTNADQLNPGELNVSWVAPAAREDNQPISLSEIAGYKIYYGNSQGQYSNNVTISDGSADGYTFTGMSAGTYYLVVTTLDTQGRESRYSAEVNITI